MMAKGHAATGAAGMALFGLIPGILPSDFGLALAIFIAAGYALWPDIDHPKATAATTWGILSIGFAHLVETISQWVYYATKTRKDVNRQGGHRTLTHTFMFAALSGLATLVFAQNIYVRLFIMFGGLCLGLRGLFEKTTRGAGKVFLYLMAALIPAYIFVQKVEGFTPTELALIVTIGTTIHSLGDCMTNSGAPLFFPIPINGQVWYRVKTPVVFSTGSEAGKRVERTIKIICLAIITVVFVIRNLGDIYDVLDKFSKLK